jgi:hypothetical protein
MLMLKPVGGGSAAVSSLASLQGFILSSEALLFGNRCFSNEDMAVSLATESGLGAVCLLEPAHRAAAGSFLASFRIVRRHESFCSLCFPSLVCGRCLTRTAPH